MLLGLGGADGALHPDRAVGDRRCSATRATTARSRSASRASSSRSSRCSASPGSSSGSSTATTTSPCRRSRRCFWNLAIIARARDRRPAGAHDEREALRLRGLDPRRDDHPGLAAHRRGCAAATAGSQLVLDWRDPAVKRTFVLMVPVTLGLGLINVNAVIDTFFASRLHRREASRRPRSQKAFLVYMLPQGMFSVAIATVLFPSLSRFATRGDMGRLPRHGEHRAAADRASCSSRPQRERRAGGADRAHPLPARRVHAAPDAGRRRVRSPRSASGSSSTARC